MLQHKDIPDVHLHEVKGAVSATAGQLYMANGDGTAGFVTPDYTKMKMGIWDYNDLATASTPMELATANYAYPIPNDTLGPFTNVTYAIPLMDPIWNKVTGYFDFSDFKLGDTVDIRIELEPEINSVNTELTLVADFGIGTAGAYQLLLDRRLFSKTGKQKYVVLHSHYFGNNDTKNNPARLSIKSDKTDTKVRVHGWYVRGITNG